MLTINNTIDGAIQDIEIKGNTVQDPDNLSDIKSVGELQEDGTYKMSILSCGKNLFDGKLELGGIDSSGNPTNKNSVRSSFIRICKDCIAKRYDTNVGIALHHYDDNYGYLGYTSWASGNRKGTNLTTYPNTKYIRLEFYNTSDININVSLYEETGDIPYEPYQEDKITILSPVPLEKVGDVSDRLYYDDVEKAWCIEKQVTTYTITGDEAWQNGSIKNGLYSSWCDNIINNRISTNKICYTSVKYVNTTEEYNSSEEPCCLLYTNGVNIKVDAIDLVSFKNKVKGMKLTYLAKTPQKIVLPLSTQITLNSFFGTTHVYMESGEVEGTIKCKIPKSLGATVQSLNNKTDILSDRIEAIEGLKDSQNMKYETDKGYLVCKETKNGVIDDLKIEGKTLVNLINDIEKDIGLSVSTDAKYDFVRKLIPNTTYTLSYTIKDLVIGTSDGVILSINKSNSYGIKEWNVNANGNYITTITTPSSTENLQLWFFAKSNAEGFSGKVCDVILLEGDHTQNPPSYFEGLMSVGQDVDKIEVLSSNNLLEEDEDYKQDKKQILFYNENGELEPIQELHEWDSMEKHSDNKWYYHKRSGKVVLNGSEDGIILLGDNTTSTLGFSINKSNFPNIKKISVYPDENKVFNDRFNYLGGTLWNVDSVGIALNADDDTRMFQIKLLKTSLNTQDVEGFKQWLQANNITVVYQLAEEEVYELAPLHLDSYANETLILCNSGAISPKMEFSITSHINELVKAYGERVNLLEEKVYQYMVTQNRMQLASTYSADSVTFKVDYFSLCGDEENYNEDLYNLILNNILVGKDNYDYDKMFTMILDYASWNQISWEQFDILVGLMDMQHNPPVEELPTEDEVEEDIIEKEETPVE